MKAQPGKCGYCGKEICQKQSNSGDGSWVWKHESGWRACDGGKFSGVIAEPASNVMPKLPTVVNIEKKSPKPMPTGYNKCFYCGEAIEKRLEGEYKGHWLHSENQDTWAKINRWSCATSKTFDGQWHVADCLLDPGPNSTIKVTKETKTVVTKTQTVTYTVQVNDKLSVPENKGRKFRTE